jgi:hypothetical protein
MSKGRAEGALLRDREDGERVVGLCTKVSQTLQRRFFPEESRRAPASISHGRKIALTLKNRGSVKRIEQPGR